MMADGLISPGHAVQKAHPQHDSISDTHISDDFMSDGYGCIQVQVSTGLLCAMYGQQGPFW
jgi:hypothetical protein